MNLLVLSRTSIPATGRTIPDWDALRALGVKVRLEGPGDAPGAGRPDAIIAMGVGVMDEAFGALARFPGAPLFAYQWDTYAWHWSAPRPATATFREPDYRRWGELLGRAAEIWVPSECTGRRVTQWWGLADWRVVLSACPWWDGPAVHDGGYALCALRRLPDPWDAAFEECCAEAGVPFRRTDHDLPYEEYQRVVAGCRFLVSHYYELSTGGLTLLEGHRLGKPVLLSDSQWHGGRDYFGGRAAYFRWGDRGDFKRALRRLWGEPPRPDPAECRAWVEANFGDARMCADVLARLVARGVAP